jgi:hypothetical protein
MAFWNSPMLQPKRKFRWVLELGLDNGELLKVAAKTVQKPNFEIGTTTHKFLNHHFYYPNRVEWKPISITLTDHVGTRDASSPVSVTDVLYKVLGDSGYAKPDLAAAASPQGLQGCEFAVTKKASVESGLKSIEILQLDGEGRVTERWKLSNAWVSKVTFGDLSYEDDGLVDLGLDIVYDWAELQKQ